MEKMSEEAENMLTWLFSNEEEEGAFELSKFLEASAEMTCPTKVKIIDDPSWHPLIFQTAASYITINGNEELCGSSFSDSDTSYMAGIGVGIGTGCGGGFVVGEGGAWDGVADEASGWIETEEEENVVNGCSTPGGYCDDDMLAKFLGDDVDQSL
ncbi:hypothetical protein HanXRQr2_Chr10g0465501 [Helianthus annuus]|uniref:Uncharacterized protein n=1 Tax=Helianthus annuus TaxID=4232 RepID=A0A251TRW9_HELAN|nr:hypothetical protein HanXRQr2_Chr10g0465501 [Helianthus annuus]